jgi:hypothetical protein
MQDDALLLLLLTMMIITTMPLMWKLLLLLLLLLQQVLDDIKDAGEWHQYQRAAMHSNVSLVQCSIDGKRGLAGCKPCQGATCHGKAQQPCLARMMPHLWAALETS